VLNVGLSAGIIEARLFSMFVVQAILLTFITTPITLWIYPERVRVRAEGLNGHTTLDVEKAGTAGVLRFTGGAGDYREVLGVIEGPALGRETFRVPPS
jgi:hypothetical protein